MVGYVKYIFINGLNYIGSIWIELRAA